LILAVFPETTRTPVEALVAGNVLFKQDPKRAYALHKLAAAGLPDSRDAQWEWAIEQQRAREYAGALKTYDGCIKSRPNYAMAYGLAAECAIREGKIAEAVKYWNDSEKATEGTMLDLETMVCEVNGPLPPDGERERLLKLVAGGDAKAAESLLLLDCDWRR